MIIQTKSISTALEELKQTIYDRHHGKWESVKTQWKNFNQLTFDGLMWGWVVTIAGESGVGKTTLLDCLKKDVLNVPDVYYLDFNLEMTSDNLLLKSLSRDTKKTVKELYGFGSSGLNYNEFVNEINPFAAGLSKKNLYYVEGTCTPKDIYDTTISFIHDHKIKEENKKLVISVDHAILVEMDNLVSGLKDIINVLNRIKRYHKYSLSILLTQYNREIGNEDRNTKYKNKAILHFPSFNDIYGGEALRQGSDLVILLQYPKKKGIHSYGPKEWVISDGVYAYIYAHFKKARWGGAEAVIRFKDNLAFNELIEDDWIGYEMEQDTSVVDLKPDEFLDLPF